MVNKTVAIYVFFDDILKSMDHKEPESRKTTDAEIITVVLLAAGYFAGNIEKSLCFVRSTGLMPAMLGKSRFNRRMHQIGELLSELFFGSVIIRQNYIFLYRKFIKANYDPSRSHYLSALPKHQFGKEWQIRERNTEVVMQSVQKAFSA
jgi:hypothetical protein